MNRLWFVILEGIKGLGRAKLAATATVFALAVALLLMGAFLLMTFHAQFFLQGLQQKEDIEILLTEDIPEEKLLALKEAFTQLSWVERVQYISKSDAAERFKKEFGEDVAAVAGYNPLPSSFELSVRWDAIRSGSLDSLASRLERLPEVDEVIYLQQFVTQIRRYRGMITQGSIIIGIIVAIIGVFLVSNTIRLSIYSKRQIITIMELVGAGRMMVYLPFLVEGAIQGILGGFLGMGLTMLLFEITAFFLPLPPLAETVYVMGGLVATGVLLGLGGSALGLRRFLS